MIVSVVKRRPKVFPRLQAARRKWSQRREEQRERRDEYTEEDYARFNTELNVSVSFLF